MLIHKIIPSGLASPVVPAWSPSDLGSSLLIWLDAQDGSTFTFNTTNVAAWANKGSLGGSASQGTAVNQPAYNTTGINSKPSVQGTGGAMWLTSTWSTAITGGLTILCVGSRTSGTGTQAFISADASNGAGVRSDASNRFELIKAGASTIGTGTSPMTNGTPYVMGVSYDLSNFSFSLNGVADGSGTNVQTFSATPKFQLMRNITTSQLIGHIGEILITQAPMSAPDLASATTYLLNKWGI